MTDAEILRSVGLGTLLDNVDHNFIGRNVLKAMKKAREDERSLCEPITAIGRPVGCGDGNTRTL